MRNLAILGLSSIQMYLYPDDVTLKNVVMLMTSVIKDIDKFYPQLFLGVALYND